MPPKKKPKKGRRVVLGEGYLRSVEFSSIHPSKDGYWPMGGFTRIYPNEGKSRLPRVRIVIERIS